MDEELRRIRAEEEAADKVYADHNETSDPHEGEDWFINALSALAPKEKK